MSRSRERLLTIAAAAQIVGRSVATLRLWEQSGKLIPERDSSGRRLYYENTVRALASALSARPAQRAKRGGTNPSRDGHQVGTSVAPGPAGDRRTLTAPKEELEDIGARG